MIYDFLSFDHSLSQSSRSGDFFSGLFLSVGVDFRSDFDFSTGVGKAFFSSGAFAASLSAFAAPLDFAAPFDFLSDADFFSVPDFLTFFMPKTTGRSGRLYLARVCFCASAGSTPFLCA